MANSGIAWVDWTFNIAVQWLYAWADVFGITYEEINVWLFVIIGPALFVLSLLTNLVLFRRLRRIQFGQKNLSAGV